MTDSAQRTRRVLVLAVAVIVVAMGFWALLNQGPHSRAASHGRVPSLPHTGFTIIVGPVNDNAGIAGVLELGMTKTRVRRNLGEPLVRGLSLREAESRHVIDPEDVSRDFYQGVFAWVEYDAGDRVMSIEFDMRAFRDDLRGHQKVALTHDGHTYLLSCGLPQRRVRDMLRSGGADVRQQTFSLVLEGTGTSLEFDSERRRLRSVHLVSVPASPGPSTTD